MRHLVIPSTLLALLGAQAGYAAESPAIPTTHTKPHQEAAKTGAAINHICPVTGKAVDPAIAAVVVSTGTGDKQITTIIGVATKAAADTINGADAKTKELYVEAAKTGKTVVKGALVLPPAH